jgi:hypothetical protein
MNEFNSNGAAGSDERTGNEILSGKGAKTWERPAITRLRAGDAENRIGGPGEDGLDKLS